VSGTQRCAADGTYGECMCGAVDAGLADAPALLDAPALPDAPAAPDAFVPIVYAGLVPNAQSAWQSLPGAEGQVGLEAGHRACQAIGGDHACDYEEVVLAEGYGQLAAIPAGTTAWLQRTTPVEVGGTTSAPGQGGNCVDWTFVGNHLADGEYITFDAVGVPTYHFDNDTFFDGVATEHVTPGTLDCGGQMRAILCCNALP